MRQIGLVLLAMGLGLGVGRLTGGFSFTPAVCIVAAVFLVTPSLLHLEREDLRFALHELRPIGLDLALNYMVLAGVALGLGWLTGDLGLAGALLLLALLPGGGMVMHWIRMSGADLRLGFILSAVNLAMVLPVTLLLAALPGLLGPAFAPPDLGGAMPGPTIRVPPFAPFMVLVIVPFALSRWLKADAPRLVRFVERHGRSLAQVTIAGIVFYLFGLRSSQLVFEMPAPVLAKA
ncbi:MAG TPA: hypothetical protein ENK80_05840, partial [Rhodobacterales bacterium]|nr:hypothetical protein [Rhodobacterales bacterium]